MEHVKLLEPMEHGLACDVLNGAQRSKSPRVHWPSAFRESNADEGRAILSSAKQCRKTLKPKRETACRHFSLVWRLPHPWPLQARPTWELSSHKAAPEFSPGDDCYHIRGVICRVPTADLRSLVLSVTAHFDPEAVTGELLFTITER
jgi:hypothetical protein